MFRDTQEELKRLEAQLLAEETEEETEEVPEAEELTEEELQQLRQLLQEPEPEYQIRNYANNYRAYNADTTDADLEEYSRELEQAGRPGRGIGLIVLAILLLAAVVGTVVWWLVRYGGLL